VYSLRPTHVVAKVLSRSECGELIAHASDNNLWGRKDIDNYDGDPTKVERCTLWPEDAPVLYERLARLFVSPKVNVWRFQLTGIYEAFNLLRYTPGCHNTPHTDYDVSRNDRSRITCVLSLSDKYEGGQAVVGPNKPPRVPAGSAIFFPSFAMHAVEEVTKGERTVVAAWAAGPEII
jgi:predicted 2-oxoglutarate/Fe(II)-dependent dioxygenase YbiX